MYSRNVSLHNPNLVKPKPMFNFLQKIKDSRLDTIIDSLKTGDPKQFKEIEDQLSEYDTAFLWLLCYPEKRSLVERRYIEENYKKFHQVLDNRFPKKFALNGNFESRMWEMILCDVLSKSGELIAKKAEGSDFILKGSDGGCVQIEAVASGEFDDKDMRSTRPDYTQNPTSMLIGGIEDFERFTLLRVINSFSNKAKRVYQKNLPLILAINSSKTIGTVSSDDYVLRRIFFGLGSMTIRQNKDGFSVKGFEQNPFLSEPNEKPFDVAVFRDAMYQHISGIIYTSQNSLGFIPGGSSWLNSGITFVPNPMAIYPIKIKFPFFKQILCDEKRYAEIDAEQEFESSITLN